MSWSWSDAITTGTAWTDSAFLNAFISAINERVKASGVGSQLATVSSGTIIQTAAFLSSLQSTVAAQVLYFVDPTTDPTLTAFANYTVTGLRSSLGLSSDWRRFRPREISTTADTADTQGNPRASGQIAMGAYNSSIRGNIYQYASGSSWTPVTNNPLPAPDMLDSNSTAPNHVAPGVIQLGDYIQPWVVQAFGDMRSLLNACTVTSGLLGSPVGGGLQSFAVHMRKEVQATDTTWLAACSAAESAYAAASPFAVTTGVPQHDVLYTGSYNTLGSISALIRRDTSIASITPNNFCARSVDWYASVDTQSTTSAAHMIDYNGDSVGGISGPTYYVLFSSTSATSSATILSGTLGDMSYTLPNRCIDADITNRGPFRGYPLIYVRYVINWKVSGGFQYV